MAWCHYLSSVGMKEALSGLPYRESLKVLADRGFIVPPDKASDLDRGNKGSLYAVPGHKKVRLYRLGGALLETNEGDA